MGLDPAGTAMVDSNVNVTLKVQANTALDENGQAYSGFLNISEVPGAVAPAALPEELGPGLPRPVEA